LPYDSRSKSNTSDFVRRCQKGELAPITEPGRKPISRANRSIGSCPCTRTRQSPRTTRPLIPQSCQKCSILKNQDRMLTCKVHIANQPFCRSATGNIKIDSTVATKRALQECRDLTLRGEIGKPCGWVLDAVVQDWLALTTRLSSSAKKGATSVSRTRFGPKRAMLVNQGSTDLFGVQYTNV